MRAYSFFSITEEFTYTVNVTSHDSYTSPEENSNGEMVEPQSFESDYLVTLDLYGMDHYRPPRITQAEKQRVASFNESRKLMRIFMNGTESVPVS